MVTFEAASGGFVVEAPPKEKPETAFVSFVSDEAGAPKVTGGLDAVSFAALSGAGAFAPNEKLEDVALVPFV